MDFTIHKVAVHFVTLLPISQHWYSTTIPSFVNSGAIPHILAMEYHGSWFIVVNPAAAGGSAARTWPSTGHFISGLGIEFTTAFTDSPETTRRLALSAANEGYGGVAVFGGDGTLSTAASALIDLASPPVLAQIPAGSGNDWIRSLGIPQDPREASVLLGQGFTRQVDTGLCRIDGTPHFFINSAGVGFDAFVLRRTMSLRRIVPLRKSGYIISLALSAIIPPRWRASITSRGRELHSGSYFTLTFGVGRYSGGGMSLSPTAVVDDGLLDAVWVLPVGFPTIAMNLPRVFNGSLMKLSQARSERSPFFSVIPEGEILLELDGDFQRFSRTPSELVFETGPMLRVISPRT